MRIVCMSDTHGGHEEVVVPEGDVLIHAGDFCSRGEANDMASFWRWWLRLPHKIKVVVPGNHDLVAESNPLLARRLFDDFGSDHHYLTHDFRYVVGLGLIWGSPITPAFGNWAFQKPRSGDEIRAHWERIPESLSILITHGPPNGILDRTSYRLAQGESVGCEHLADAVFRRKPKLHVFGHIHEGHGVIEKNGTIFVNASIMDKDYEIANNPVVIDL